MSPGGLKNQLDGPLWLYLEARRLALKICCTSPARLVLNEPARFVLTSSSVDLAQILITARHPSAVGCVTHKTLARTKKHKEIEDKTKKKKEEFKVQDLKKYHDVHVSITHF